MNVLVNWGRGGESQSPFVACVGKHCDCQSVCLRPSMEREGEVSAAPKTCTNVTYLGGWEGGTVLTCLFILASLVQLWQLPGRQKLKV